MECDKVKTKIGNYLDQELKEFELKDVAGHLKNCSKCSVHLEQFREIEALVNSDLYELPPEQYWQGLPGIISSRLGLPGLHQQKNPNRVGIFDSVIGFFRMPRVHWGIAGAMALLLIVLLSGFPNLNDEMPVVTNEPVLSEELTEALSEKQTVSGDAIKPPIPDAEPQEMVANTDSRTKEDHAGETVDPPTLEVHTPEDDLFLPAENAVAKLRGKSPELNKVGDNQPGFNKELIPIPAPEIHIADKTSDERSTSNNLLGVNTLSLDTGTETQDPLISSILENEFGFENSFVEIKGIVDESLTLDEKKNIWLSYISREPNSTYRSLATYHLALVLYDIAEQSGEFEDAKTASDLLVKYENALREQMGKNGFDARLNALDLIMLE